MILLSHFSRGSVSNAWSLPQRAGGQLVVACFPAKRHFRPIPAMSWIDVLILWSFSHFNRIYLYLFKDKETQDVLLFANSKQMASHLWPNNQRRNQAICVSRDPSCWGRQGSCERFFPLVRPSKRQAILFLPEIICLKRAKYQDT